MFNEQITYVADKNDGVSYSEASANLTHTPRVCK